MQSYGSDFKRIFNIFYVQTRFIVAIILVVFCLAAYLAVSLPDVYRSSTLILVTPQKLPPSYINSTITSSIEQRLRAISDEILSRTRLEKIIQEFNLYPMLDRMDLRVSTLRKAITVDVRRSDAFALLFKHPTPEMAMKVTNRLAGLFIEENLQIREQQAAGTTTFINAEVDRLRKELEQQEAEVNLYKAQHRFELPEQLDANLRTLEQLRIEFQANMLRLSALQDRKANLEKQLVEAKFMPSDGQQGAPVWQSVETRKLQLEDLLTRYSDKHPDVIRLKSEIRMIEAEADKQRSQTKGSTSTEAPLLRNPVQQTLLKQMADLNLEINALRTNTDALKGQIASYQVRVDNNPVRSIELAKITRAYDITLKKYQDLQGKSMDSQLSENMERKQKGEQFQIIDPANLPQEPYAPDRLRILGLGFALALIAGFGFALLRQSVDTSFNRGDDLKELTNLPILATIPAISTRGSVLEQRRSQRMLVLISGAVLVVGLLSIHLYGTIF
jgi:polysaccharide chain length determinant protein (PEP-CTERM system associated)